MPHSNSTINHSIIFFVCLLFFFVSCDKEDVNFPEREPIDLIIGDYFGMRNDTSTEEVNCSKSSGFSSWDSMTTNNRNDSINILKLSDDSISIDGYSFRFDSTNYYQKLLGGANPFQQITFEISEDTIRSYYFSGYSLQIVDGDCNHVWITSSRFSGIKN